MSANRIYIYKRYERFWHWSQALLIIVMMITGLRSMAAILLGFRRPWMRTRSQHGRCW